MIRHVHRALAVVTTLAVHASARAENPWLVVPVVRTSDAPAVIDLATAAASQLSDALARTAPVITSRSAALKSSSIASAAPPTLGVDEVGRLRAALASGRRQLGVGKVMEAQDVLAPFDALSDNQRDYLRRDAQLARQMFDVCVMRALQARRASAQSVPSSNAASKMLGCIRTYRVFDPPAGGELARLFEEAMAQAALEPRAELEVRSQPACTVRLFGIDVGTSPVVIENVQPGPVRIQLECQRNVAGRQHTVQLAHGRTVVTLDPQLDNVLRSSTSAIWLAYPTESMRTARVDLDGSALARRCDARVLALLVEQADAQGVTIQLHDVSRARPGIQLRYAIAGGFSAGQLSTAVRSLKLDDAREVPAYTPDPEQSSSPRPSPASRSSSVALSIGIALGAVGIAGTVATVVSYADRQTYRLRPWSAVTEDVDAGFASRGTRTVMLALGSATAFVAAEYLLLPDHASVPLLAWVTGGVGLAVAAVGIGYAAAAKHCGPEVALPGSRLDRQCQSWTSDDAFGPLLLLGALPLINVPCAYLLRSLGSASGELTILPGGLAVRMRL